MSRRDASDHTVSLRQISTLERLQEPQEQNVFYNEDR